MDALKKSKKKKKYTVVFAVCLSVLLLFKYEMLPGSIFVLPIDSPLFSLALCIPKEAISVDTAAVTPCKVMCKKWKQNVH